MRRILAILVCVALVLAGCRRNGSEPTVTTQEPTSVPTTQPDTQPPTTEPTAVPTETEPPVPDTLSATALADRTEVVLTTVDRGAEVEIAGEYEEDYYIVKVFEGYGLMEKRLIRMDGAKGYEGWTGYAVSQAKVYTHYHLLPDGAKTLKMNTKVTVLDNLGGTLVIQTEDGIGYMREKELSRGYIQPAPSGSADGGDIVLGGMGGNVNLSNFVSQSGGVSGKGTVLADEAEIVLGWFDRGEVVAVIDEEGFLEEKEGWYGIYHEGLYGYVRQGLLRKDGEEPYSQWNGFAKRQAPLFDNHYLMGEPVSKLAANAKVQILEDLEHCYLATSGDQTGYIAKDMVSETKINYSSGNSGGDWTPPAL